MKQKIQFIPLSVWMDQLDATICYKVTGKSFFAKDLFVLALNKCFVTPDRLYSSMASSENKSAFKKKRLKKERKVNIYKL